MITVIEGFDITGKAGVADYIRTSDLSRYRIIRTPYETYERFLDHGQFSWMLCKNTIDTLDQLLLDDGKINPILDRSFTSFFVYTEFWNLYTDRHDEILEIVKSCKSFMDALHIHVEHSNKDDASKIYESFLNNKTRHRNSNDKFESFDEYWKKYLKIQELYYKWYDKIGIRPAVVVNGYNERYYN